MAKDKIVVVDDFISAGDCRDLLHELKSCVWQPSGVLGRAGAHASQREVVYGDTRTSHTVHEDQFPAALGRKVTTLAKKIAALIGTDARKFESWQALNYESGEQFDFHVDAGANFAKEAPGERRRSVLVYLEPPLRGGETHFRALNLKIKAEAGKLAVWNNLLPSGLPDYAMIHAGLPVLQGSKTILVTWERERICKKKPHNKTHEPKRKIHQRSH